MTIVSATKARDNLYQIISDVNANCEPITITNNKGKNAVLIGEADWRAIEESILAGGKTPIKECISEEEVEW